MKKDNAITKIKVLTKSLIPSEEKKTAATAPEAADEHPWLSHVAVLTGILAALTGFLTVRSTTYTNEAIYESNQAVLAQTEASDAWTEYQADSIKARVVEVQLVPSNPISVADRQQLTADDKDLRDRQPKIKEEALDKLKQRQTHLDNALKRLAQKDMLGYAGMAAQLGIAVASIAALTRRRSFFYIGAAAGIVSVAVTAYTLIGS